MNTPTRTMPRLPTARSLRRVVPSRRSCRRYTAASTRYEPNTLGSLNVPDTRLSTVVSAAPSPATSRYPARPMIEETTAPAVKAFRQVVARDTVRSLKNSVKKITVTKR